MFLEKLAINLFFMLIEFKLYYNKLDYFRSFFDFITVLIILSILSLGLKKSKALIIWNYIINFFLFCYTKVYVLNETTVQSFFGESFLFIELIQGYVYAGIIIFITSFLNEKRRKEEKTVKGEEYRTKRKVIKGLQENEEKFLKVADLQEKMKIYNEYLYEIFLFKNKIRNISIEEKERIKVEICNFIKEYFEISSLNIKIEEDENRVKCNLKENYLIPVLYNDKELFIVVIEEIDSLKNKENILYELDIFKEIIKKWSL